MPVIKLHPLQWTNGQQVGSINIEQDFARDIISRLRAIGLWSRPDQEPPVLQGEVVSMEKFVTWKEKFDGRMLERFLPLFADQAWRGDFPDVGINGGYIKLDR